ncbi:Serine/threonine-protein kinase, partial [Spiromyces aspiralis]
MLARTHNRNSIEFNRSIDHGGTNGSALITKQHSHHSHQNSPHRSQGKQRRQRNDSRTPLVTTATTAAVTTTTATTTSTNTATTTNTTNTNKDCSRQHHHYRHCHCRRHQPHQQRHNHCYDQTDGSHTTGTGMATWGSSTQSPFPPCRNSSKLDHPGLHVGAKRPACTGGEATASDQQSGTPSLSTRCEHVPITVSIKDRHSRRFLLHTPLGEFQVVRTLGQGSYGRVRLMRSALTNEQYAVKIIRRYPPHKHHKSHPEHRKAKTLDRRIVREANLAAILGQLHPNIVPLHDFRVTDTHLYLFYEFVDGMTLAEKIGSTGLPESEAKPL